MKNRIIIVLLSFLIVFPSFATMYTYETEYGNGMAEATVQPELYKNKKVVQSQDWLFQRYGYDGYLGINKLSKIQEALMWKALNEYHLKVGEVYLIYVRPDERISAFILAYIDKKNHVRYAAIGSDIFFY